MFPRQGRGESFCQKASGLEWSSFWRPFGCWFLVVTLREDGGIRKWTTGYLSKHWVWVTPVGEASAATFLGCGCLQPGFFSPPLGKPHKAVSSPAISDGTKWGNTKVYYVARSSRPLLRRNESSQYFYGSRVRLGEGGIWERGNWGNGREGVGGSVVALKRFLYATQTCATSKQNSIGFCDFSSRFFLQIRKKIIRNCSAEPASAELSFLTFFFLGIQLSDFNL